MFSTSHHLVRAAALTAVAIAVIGLGAAPASARPEPGPTIIAVAHHFGGTHDTGGGCVLQRVGSQFVRCDDLTGNGVPAPAYIPER